MFSVAPFLPSCVVHSVLYSKRNIIAGYICTSASWQATYQKLPAEKIKPDHFIYTLLISLTIQVLAMFTGWKYELIQQWLGNGFLTWYIWKLAKILAGIIANRGVFSVPAIDQPAKA